MLRTFERKKIDKILWQPRLEHWYNVNRIHGTLPERYRDMELLEIYDDLSASVRTYGMFNRTVKITQGEEIHVLGPFVIEVDKFNLSIDPLSVSSPDGNFIVTFPQESINVTSVLKIDSAIPLSAIVQPDFVPVRVPGYGEPD